MEDNFKECLVKLSDKLADYEYAVNMYRALCNMRWIKTWHASDYMLQELDRIHRRPIREREIYSCSWRYAGGLVARLRGEDEDYLDFYCSGDEGYVDPKIKADLKRLGWETLPWDLPKPKVKLKKNPINIVIYDEDDGYSD